MNHPATEKDLFQFFKDLGISVDTHRHAPFYTVADAKALRGNLEGGHCKTLLVKDKKGRYAVIVADEEKPVDLKYIAQQIGLGRVSFASAERLYDVLGVLPGSVTPFALINRQIESDTEADLLVILDAEMMRP